MKHIRHHWQKNEIAAQRLDQPHFPAAYSCTGPASMIASQLPQKPVASHKSHWSADFMRQARSLGAQAAKAIS